MKIVKMDTAVKTGPALCSFPTILLRVPKTNNINKIAINTSLFNALKPIPTQ